ncbi:hypothetical protein [Streptomyces graminofaciens]|uniref:hypothetical protein n=1 Tax=Streptomyces graminofaciens TaxID=68212 RepID=UPI0025724C6E|nr:hypothetical protein [Streptomyces graminofaciens]
MSGGRQHGTVTQAHTITNTNTQSHNTTTTTTNLWFDLSQAASVSPGAWLLGLELLGLGAAAWFWPGGPLSQYAVFGILCASALATAGWSVVIARSGNDEGRADQDSADGGDGEPMDAAQRLARERMAKRRRLLARVALPVTSVLFAVAGLLAFQHVVATGEIPTEVRIRGSQLLQGPRSTPLTLVVPAPEEPREKLRLELTLADYDDSTGTCVHKTTATVTAATPGVTPNRKEMTAEDTVDFDLGGNKGPLRFQVTVRTEANCTMRLAKATGTLHN